LANDPDIIQARSLSADNHPGHNLAVCSFDVVVSRCRGTAGERVIDVSNETVRCWFLKFGRLIASNLRRSRPRPSPRWHLDEIVIKIRDRKYWLWRAVDEEGEVLDFLVQRRRCARSVGRLLRKLLEKQGFAPTRITTDKLKSYPAAIRN
jgi:transposase-like protein